MFDAEQYYEDFIRYADLAKTQQAECNLGVTPHTGGSIKDPLMQNVTLYDVVNRKYAGFGQLLLDLWYGGTPQHPYAHKMHEVRQPIAKSFNGVHTSWELEEWLYVFLTHRVMGSAIDYGRKYAGYGPTILPELYRAWDLDDLVLVMQEFLPHLSLLEFQSLLDFLLLWLLVSLHLWLLENLLVLLLQLLL